MRPTRLPSPWVLYQSVPLTTGSSSISEIIWQGTNQNRPHPVTDELNGFSLLACILPHCIGERLKTHRSPTRKCDDSGFGFVFLGFIYLFISISKNTENNDLSLIYIVLCSAARSVFIRKELVYSYPFTYVTLKFWVLFKFFSSIFLGVEHKPT